MSAIADFLHQSSARTGLPAWLVGAAAAGAGVAVGAAVLRALAPARRLQKGDGLAVVVTGCDTGFGNLTALQLASSGFTVYAACLTDKGIAEFHEHAKRDASLKGIRPVKLDVTKAEDVKALRELVEREVPDGLYCLVSNAGLHAAYKWELSTIDMIQRDIDVNYIGGVRVSLALAPSLRKFARSRAAQIAAGAVPAPRLVTITSSAGFYPSSPYGPYAASKHAARVFAITFRQEVAPHGVLVSSVEPFFARTPFLTVVDERKIAKVLAQPQEVVDAYGGAADVRKRMSRSGFHTAVPKDLLEPETVVKGIVDQVELWKPAPHCVIGRTAKALSFLSPILSPARVDAIAADFEKQGMGK